MKDFLKAYKLYFKTTFSPGCAVLGVILMLFHFLLVFVLGWAHLKESKTETVMFSILLVFHSFGILFFQRYNKMLQNKVFFSFKNAKLYYTVIPMAVVGTVFLIIDIISFIMSLCLCGGEFAGDLLVFYSAGTVLMTLFHVTQELPKLSGLSALAVISTVMISPPAICYASGIKYGLGFSLGVDILISLGNYIVGAALIIGIMTLWWNKSGRSLEFVEKDIWGFRKRRR